MMRGNNRENIFVADEQKRFFLESLKRQEENQLIDIAAYCFMDNHVHIVIKAVPSDLSKAIKSINIRYAMNFNGKRDRIGHVFQDRYKSEAIIDDKYLLQAIRYIHNNPIKAKMVKSLEDYYWSSYNEYVKEGSIIKSQQREFILGYFSNDVGQFIAFHKQKDNQEYMEIKEDILKNRIEQAQEIISVYFSEKGLVEAKQFNRNAVYTEEMVQRLLIKSKLTHRQIANLLGVSNNTVHNVSMQRHYKDISQKESKKNRPKPLKNAS